MSSREPSPRYSHAAVGIRQRLYIWGGRGPTGIESNTIHSFDVPSLTWEEPQQFKDGYLPGGLRGMAVSTDGEITYSFGGKHGTSSNWTYRNTLYQLNLPQSTLRNLLPANSCSQDVPSTKDDSGMVHFNQKLVVYGGFGEQGKTDELHIFDLREKVWAVQPTTGDAPPPLAWHTFTKVDHHRAVVFGGDAECNINNTYVLDMETWHWTKMNIRHEDRPPARSFHDACYIAGPLTGQQHPVIMVVGGLGDERKVLNDAWLLDVDKGVWNEVSLPVNVIARFGHSAVVFGSGPSFRVVVLFGGCKSVYRDDEISETTLLLLELRGGSWQVTRVMKPDELGRPDESLREQMKKLELSPQGKDTAHTIVEFDLSDLNIRKEKKLGKGAFGNVYEGSWKKSGGAMVAVKVTQLRGSATLSQEIKVWRALPQHRNIIKLIGVATDKFNIFIVTELAVNGSLFDYLHIEKNTPSVDQSLAWALDTAHGMKHLHDHDIIHRDLKSANVLLTREWVAKLCDFGTARELTHTTTTEQAGTYRWMPPEIMRKANARINKKCDLFSYGMILFELFAHVVPYTHLDDNVDVLLNVIDGKRPPIPPTLPPYLHDLLRSCWEEDTHLRPTFNEFVDKLVQPSSE